MVAARSDLLTRVGSAIVLFAIAGTALWFGGIAFGLLLLVGGALVVVEEATGTPLEATAGFEVLESRPVGAGTLHIHRFGAAA